MQDTVQITLKAHDQASPVVDGVSQSVQSLNQTLERNLSSTDSLHVSLSEMIEDLDKASTSLDTLESGWEAHNDALEENISATRYLADISTESYYRMGAGLQEATNAVGIEIDSQSNSWAELWDSVDGGFTKLFQGIIDSSSETGEYLVDFLINLLSRLQDIVASEEITIPISTSINSQSADYELFSSLFPLADAADDTSAIGSDTGQIGQNSSGLLETILNYVIPAIGVAGLGISLFSKLFEDRPQPRFDTSGQVPGSYQQFVSLSPSELLSVDEMNSDARESAGTDAAAVQAAYDIITGGFQDLFRSAYESMPDAVQEAWDAIDVESFDFDPRVSKRKTTALAIADHLKQWVTGLDDTLTDELLDATAQAFSPENAEQVGQLWNQKLSDWFDPLLAGAETLDAVQAAVAQYGQYLSAFFAGVSGIMAYRNADIWADLETVMDDDPFRQLSDSLSLVDKQIMFILEDINSLEGLDYANALAEIASLEAQDYELRLQYLAQLKTLQESLLGSLESQSQGYAWDVMTPEERYSYADTQAGQAWNDIFRAETPSEAASATQQYLYWDQQRWDIGGNLYGEDWQKENLPSFESNTDTIGTFIEDTFGEAMDDIVAGRDDIADATTKAVGGLEDFDTQIEKATTGIGDLNDELPSLKDNLANVNLEVAASKEVYARMNLEVASLVTALQGAVGNINQIIGSLSSTAYEVNA